MWITLLKSCALFGDTMCKKNTVVYNPHSFVHKHTIRPQKLLTNSKPFFQQTIHRLILRLKVVSYAHVWHCSTTNTTTLYYY